MKNVDLNCDLGEGIGNDELIMPYISSANIACGYHAGNTSSIRKTIQLAAINAVAIGAHPGYLDKNNFGRTPMYLSTKELDRLVREQIEILSIEAEEQNKKLSHVKVHGALYNQAATNRSMASTISKAVYSENKALLFIGLANSVMLEEAKQLGLHTASEVFADRAYTNDGLLVPRSQRGAVLHDVATCTARVLGMVLDGVVESIHGKIIPIQADTVCVHGDNPKAVQLTKKIYAALQNEQIQIKAIAS